MRPLLVLQHHADVGPGQFEVWLQARRLPFERVRIDQGATVPASAAAWAGVCSLGGTMSANDPLPWIADELALLADADARGVPVIGHCLGGQLLAQALGGRVLRHPVKEIGWWDVMASDLALARDWIGADGMEVFQWHGDSYVPPPGARSFLTSPLCAEQAYVIERPRCTHLGMQFHVEMTPALVEQWLADATWFDELAAERAATGGPGVQDRTAMLHDLERRAARMARVAWRLYDRWWAAAGGSAAKAAVPGL